MGRFPIVRRLARHLADSENARQLAGFMVDVSIIGVVVYGLILVLVASGH